MGHISAFENINEDLVQYNDHRWQRTVENLRKKEN